MVRWGFILFLTMLVAAQVTCSKDEDDEDETTTTDPEDDGDEDEVSSRQPSEPTTTAPRMTRTISKPLQCFVCSFKRDSSERHCLDPLRHNVSSMYCRTPGDKCFTAVETRESGVSIAVRGCKTDCISSPDIACCETDRCNSRPVTDRPTHLHTVSVESAASKSLPQTILYFVTVLLLLKAVVQVNIL